MNPSHTASLVTAGFPPSPSLGARLLRAYSGVAQREWLACAVVLFAALGIRAALLPWYPPPQPAVHDEFSYLLAADTYASGRIANPPHPMWRHFETFHELMQPVYASKYQPLQGLVLAFGQKFFGQPWIGVYLSAGVMCAAMCWMFQGWLTPNFALLGALLFMLRLGIFDYWMNSFWGGAVSATGGALVLGALVRICRKPRVGNWLALAAGLVMLMHSRPWEGSVLGLEALAALMWAWRKLPSASRAKALRAAVPALGVIAAGLGAVAYVNHRVTGNALLLPQALYDRQYSVAPNFAIQSLHPEPAYRHAPMRDLFAGAYVDLWRATRTDPLAVFLEKLSESYDFFFGLWPLLIPPLVWPYALKTVEERLAVLLLGGFLLVAILPLSGFQFHYAAPIAGLMYVRLMQTLSRLRHWRPTGLPIGFAVAGLFVLLFGYQFAGVFAFYTRYYQPPQMALDRAKVIRDLAREPGKQLVLVHYAKDHVPHHEWVFNRADIDASAIVWAREMSPREDAELLDYFHDRRAWVLDADASPPRLIPYPVKEIASR